jgi:hypothetical protein
MFGTPVARVFLVIASSSILWSCSSSSTPAERMHTVSEFMRRDIHEVEEQLASVQSELDTVLQPSTVAPLRERANDLALRLEETASRMESSLAATDMAQFHRALEDLTTIQIDADRLESDTMLVER